MYMMHFNSMKYKDRFITTECHFSKPMLQNASHNKDIIKTQKSNHKTSKGQSIKQNKTNKTTKDSQQNHANKTNKSKRQSIKI